MEDLDFEVRKENLYEIVTDRMKGMTLSNSLRQRERLPSEQELTLEFGISRNVMRESLKLLKERQLIMQKDGEGIFIAKPESGSVIEILNRMLRLNNIGYVDVYEMRRLLGPYVSRAVAEKEDDLNFGKLEQYLQGVVEGKDVRDMRTNYGVQFHICVIEAVGNPLLIYFIKPMVSLRKTILLKGVVKQQEGRQDGIELHKRIIESLKKGGPDKTEAVMRAHIEKSAKIYWMEDTQ